MKIYNLAEKKLVKTIHPEEKITKHYITDDENYFVTITTKRNKTTTEIINRASGKKELRVAAL